VYIRNDDENAFRSALNISLSFIFSLPSSSHTHPCFTEASRAASSRRAVGSFGVPTSKSLKKPDKSLETANSTTHGHNNHAVMMSFDDNGSGKSAGKGNNNGDSNSNDGSDSDDGKDDNGHSKGQGGHPSPSQGGLPPFPFPCSYVDDNSGQIQFLGPWSLNITGPSSPFQPAGMTSRTTVAANSTASITFTGQ
jgi:hypothetical protein